MKDIFKNIYEKNLWGEGSGPGSTMNATNKYRKLLNVILRKYKIKSVVDFGCGDWKFSQFINWNGINYHGFDVVDHVVQENKKKFKRENINFSVPIDNNELPSADLIIVKDVLQHWDNRSIFEFIPVLRKYKYALITNYYDATHVNTDIPIGGWRAIDLSKKPFGLNAKLICKFNVVLSLPQKKCWRIDHIPYNLLVIAAPFIKGIIIEKKAVFLLTSIVAPEN